MNNFKLTIGIEVHAVLNTRSKMFSSSPCIVDDSVNTYINEIDLGLPGVLPSPNRQAVIKGLILAKALEMKIDHNLKFDRKNYFYPDLPKGFQITQQYNPIGKNGKIKLSNGKIIRIERIHLEEDTAKQVVLDNQICLDYNRCGMPLIEIVSHPDIESIDEAHEFLVALKRILIFLNISDGKMENGSLRVDLNISVAPVGATELGTKVEIKNINSFANVIKAIQFEFIRQVRELLKGEKIRQETRRWDDVKSQTIFMRLKSNSVDYHYFCEPNIININIDEEFNSISKNDLNNLPSKIKDELIKQNVPNDIIEQLLNDYDAYQIFKYVNEKINNASLSVTWIIVELASLLKKENKTYKSVSQEMCMHFIDMFKLLNDGKINGKQAKTIFSQIYSSNKSPPELIRELNFVQITDENMIRQYLCKYIEQNKVMTSQYKERPERVEKFFIGLLMKDTKGQANPVIATNILKSLINK